MSDSDEEPPFDMEQIKTQGSGEEQDRELVHFVRAKLEPEAKLTKLSPFKSEQIKSKIVANHIATTSKAKAIAAKEKAKHAERVLAIVEAGHYQVAPVGGLPSRRARFLWRTNGPGPKQTTWFVVKLLTIFNKLA